jgi:hypothetical protein
MRYGHQSCEASAQAVDCNAVHSRLVQVSHRPQPHLLRPITRRHTSPGFTITGNGFRVLKNGFRMHESQRPVKSRARRGQLRGSRKIPFSLLAFTWPACGEEGGDVAVPA